METKEKELDLREMFEMLKKKWWLIMLLTILGAGIAFSYTVKYVTPVYEAKTVLYIGNENSVLAPLDISIGQLEAGSQLLIDYKEIALTRLVINEVIKNVGLNIPYEDFQKNMVIENVGDSRLFTVGYRNPNPETAKIVADELAKQLSVAVLQIVGVENIRILDQALLPQTPSAPSKYLNAAIGALFGFLMSLLIIYIIFLSDDTVKNEEDIEKLIGVSVLGNSPEFKKKHNGIEEPSLVTLSDPSSYVTESYKLLRTNLNFKNTKNKYQVILMTSSGKEEGKSTTICNLAITFAQSGKRVLLIDGDLRRPQVSAIFDINKRKKGLSNMLVDAMPLDSLINKVEKLDKLEILPAGTKPVSPTELLNSETFETLITKSRDEYDIILIDTPPALSFADASIIAKVADGVLLVVAASETKKAIVVEVKKNLDKVGATIIGVVLTKVKFNKKANYYRYDYEEGKSQ